MRGVIPKPRVFSSAARDLGRVTWHRRLVDFTPSFRQVVPTRIHRINESYLFASPPAFDFLLASDRRVWVEEAFVVCKPRQVVPASETVNELILMLKYAAGQIADDAYIEHVRTRPVRHDVNVKLFRLAHNSTRIRSTLTGGISRQCAFGSEPLVAFNPQL